MSTATLAAGRNVAYDDDLDEVDSAGRTDLPMVAAFSFPMLDSFAVFPPDQESSWGDADVVSQP